MKYLANILLFITLLPSCGEAQLNTQQEIAKYNGIMLYNQYKATSAISLLTIAADAGDHEAQYYLGEALRKKNHYMNKEAKKWYEASADQNNLYAMIQLGRIERDICEISNDCAPSQKSPIEWLNQAKKIAQGKADAGDAEAMCIMYEITLDDRWLEKSASAGNAFAQYWMAVSLKQGDGFFLPWKRSEAVEKWFKLSAESGYPKSMMEYAAILYERGDMEGYRHWVEKTALTGYATTVFGYGSDLAHEPNTFGYPLDLIKGYALIYWLSELDGGGGMKENVEYTLPRIAAKMTAEQIEAAKRFSQEWAASHPPLSFFPDKLSR
ncbi:sel1 repeat family protein [Pseudomonas sp. SWRI99]|uniref:tetratricopeptide repeat protein n=1 Tax=Pseudomonas sp. SWRI99 TaxID=2745506 RepID=UPI00164872FA|nr:sel1 repeat family protein [Pseudomonas sp. SWRI99]MBC3775427.1 sel1 repeat family protein [Pseudomonas sp. SWRI99]